MLRTSLVFLCAVTAALAAQQPRTLPANLYFEPNRGQAHPGVEFVARGCGLAAYLLDGEAILRAGADPVLLRLPGARPVSGEGLDPLPGVSSYFTGRDASQWHAGIPQYRRIRYRNVYPGVDLVYYGADGRMEFDFVLSPGADPSRVRLHYDGVRSLSIDHGDLLVSAPSGSIRQKPPSVYQEDASGRRRIAASYSLDRNGDVRFTVDRYRNDLPLVIDPVLEYGTYFGGSAYETATALQSDAAGNVYIAGNIATPDSDANPFVSTRSGGSRQAVLIKFAPSSNTIVYVVHLGGGATDSATGVAIDANGAAYLGGITNSSSFPLINAFQTQMKTWGANPVGFIAKVAPDGKAWCTRVT